MKKFFHLVVLGFLALLFTGCMQFAYKYTYTDDEVANIGFDVQNSTKLSSPAADKARIYLALNDPKELPPTSVFYKYNPSLDQNGTPTGESMKYGKDNLIATFPGSYTVMDFEANKPLLLIGTQKFPTKFKVLAWFVPLMWPFAIYYTFFEPEYGDVGLYWLFTPEAGKTYCMQPLVIGGSSWSNITKDQYFLNQQECENLVK